MAYRFGTQVSADLESGAHREWLVTDGRGGYAMGTVSGLRTRRYHGLLVVADPTPARRMLALAALDPVLELPSGATVRLAVHEWASGAVDPAGHLLLDSVEVRDGLPRWRWRVGEVVLERELALRDGCVGVVHRLVAGPPVRLGVAALGTWRDAHGERRAGDGLRVVPVADGAVVEDAWRIAGPGFTPAGDWYLGAFAREEAARGLNPVEDLRHLGDFSAVLSPGETLDVVAWTGSREPPPATEIVTAARQRAARIAAGRDSVAATLAVAADAFVVTTPTGPDVVAGYPWFGVWSRDTMTAYEGLFLVTGRVDEGRELLRCYAATVSEGMLANTADTGATEYNTADAALWFLHAVGRHVEVTGDDDLAADLLPTLDAIVAAHLSGTRFGIRVDPTDGLLTQGAPGYALTWMDARVDGVPVTPRHGKAVELNALWINGLGVVAALGERLGNDAPEARRHWSHAASSFASRYPSPHGWLYDVVDGPAGDDPALRPNQLLAWSLPYGPRPDDPRPVQAATRALLTPLGLRSLAPDDPAYRGRHRGGPGDRDRAYHQGTVWPWLIGPYADAVRATTGGTSGDKRSGDVDAGLFDGLVAHLGEWGVFSASETADGDPPHSATGCPYQAWSVAELLRAWRRG